VEPEQKPVPRLDVITGSITKVMAVVSSFALAAMMAITVIDVVGRYFFLHPLKGAFEMAGILLVIAASWGMGYCQFLKGHIRIDMLFIHFPPRMQAVFNAIAYLIGIVGVSIITWQTLLRMYEYMYRELGGTTETLGMPFWPFMLMMAIGFGWFCVLLLIDLYRSLVKVFER
jgi:TRAP-type C4-dicarboxylate transport system permease small subunit